MPRPWASVLLIAAFGATSMIAQTEPRPQDDLYRVANAEWLRTTTIPEDRANESASTELFDRVERDVRAIIEEIAAQKTRRSPAAQQILDLYRSATDGARIDDLGVKPLMPILESIERIDSPRLLGDMAGSLTATTTAGPFFAALIAHPERAGERAVRLSQGGLTLERIDYVNSDEHARAVRERYREYLARVFETTRRPNAAADADAVLEFEIQLARAFRTAAAPDTPELSTTERMNRELPGFDWIAWGRRQGISSSMAIVLQQPTFFRTFATVVSSRPMATSRAWLAGRYILSMSNYVSEDIALARFDFFGRFLTGQEAPRPRWKRGVGLVNTVLPDAIGRLYVERHLSRSTRARVERIATDVLRAYRDAVDAFNWPQSFWKLDAQNRLGRLSVRVGAPSEWREYPGLVVRADDLFGNHLRAQKYDNDRRMQQGGRLAGGGEWPLGAQTTIAFYHPNANEVIIPAGILQPPYFDASADDAVNYGAIGAVIGHEAGHSLDQSGRQMPRGMSSESWNDVVGLAVAWEAFKRSRATVGVEVSSNDERRFFEAWARIWRELVRPEFARRLTVLSGQYPPGDARANSAVIHLDAFYRAFDVLPGDRLFLAPDRRIRLF